MLCLYCDQVLCYDCQSTHETFIGAQSLSHERGTLHQADDEVTDAAIDSLISEVEMEVDKGIDPLTRKLEEEDRL